MVTARLRVHLTAGSHPEGVRSFFPAPEPDAFYDASVTQALYGDAWTSILIEDGRSAFRHAYAASSIGATGQADIEPLLGYAGPLVSAGATPAFLAEALAAYSAHCRERGIVGELVRFNPLLGNAEVWREVDPSLVVRSQKPVAFLDLTTDPDAQLARYPAATRNMVRAGERSSVVGVLERTAEQWAEFLALLEAGLQAAGAGEEWSLPSVTLERFRRHPAFVLVGARHQDRLVAAALGLIAAPTAYYILAASVRDAKRRRGASNAVVHALAQAAAAAGATRLGLGGGNSADPEDPLLRFKRSFGGEVRSFSIGLLSHDAPALDALRRQAEAAEPGLRNSPLFLRHRLAPRFAEGRMLPSPGPWRPHP